MPQAVIVKSPKLPGQVLPQPAALQLAQGPGERQPVKRMTHLPCTFPQPREHLCRQALRRVGKGRHQPIAPRNPPQPGPIVAGLPKGGPIHTQGNQAIPRIIAPLQPPQPIRQLHLLHPVGQIKAPPQPLHPQPSKSRAQKLQAFRKLVARGIPGESHTRLPIGRLEQVPSQVIGVAG